eukprot:TRINITY_DN21401_c0_g2_i1.p2 TRINITY_DN21401_c0_g2~~TRINITY_DN21401_c0_g2_i1.p2  ORF type:complete len:292 (+),score=98.51 TRINITY_DN21401_c0_g2_i1:85-876(+)
MPAPRGPGAAAGAPRPRAVLLDMDGVIAEVKRSYRAAILGTCAFFGAPVTHEEVSEEKRKGNANNDWVLSQRLIRSKIGEDVPLAKVTEKFEEFYQGTPGRPGLHTLETLIPAKGVLAELHRRTGGRMAVVTGRPRRDCDTFLREHDLGSLFSTCVCMEDGPAKPHPHIVTLACKRLGVDPSEALMVGDTPDDITAAARAGLSYLIGVLLPDDDARLTLNPEATCESVPIVRAMLDCGATHIIRSGLAELLDIVPPPPPAAAL